MTKTCILIAEPHELVRRGVSALLNAQSDLEVCGEASNEADAIRAAADLQPQLIVTDPSTSALDGATAVGQFLARCPTAHLLVLSSCESAEFVRTVISAGAHGYALRSDPAADFLAAVYAVARGHLFLTSKIARSVLECAGNNAESAFVPNARSLTPREWTVMQLIGQGKSNKHISLQLKLSPKTVETHRARIMNKLEMHSAAELIHFAVRNHLITEERPAESARSFIL